MEKKKKKQARGEGGQNYLLFKYLWCRIAAGGGEVRQEADMLIL